MGRRSDVERAPVSARRQPGTSQPARLSLAEPLLTPAEAAELLAVRTSWIYEAVRNGSGRPAIRLGKHIRFTRSMLEAWLLERAA